MRHEITMIVDDGGTAGTADNDRYVWSLPITGKVVKAYAAAETAITANASNYATFSLEVAATSIASEATTVADTGNIAADTAEELVLTGTGTGLEVSQGTVLEFKSAKTGTGVAHNKVRCTVLVEEIRA
jgi:hypothetical protein